jgi:hypothetical protein
MGTPVADSWGEDDNARRYNTFAREYPNYQETSRDLIAVGLPSADPAVSICRSLAATGFDIELVTEVSHQDSAESQRAWLSIPIFTRDRLRGLPYQDRMRVLDKAYERLGPGPIRAARWAVFVARRQPPQPQAPPQQPAPEAGVAAERPRPPRATADSSLTVSSWPCGQTAGADDSLMGRVCSKVSPQARHRYSYLGTIGSLSGQSLMGDGSATSTAGTDPGSV